MRICEAEQKEKVLTTFVVCTNRHVIVLPPEWNNVVPLSEYTMDKFNTEKMKLRFEKFLLHSNPEDLLLLSGATVMNCIACAIFAKLHSRLNLLIFDPYKELYILKEILFH